MLIGNLGIPKVIHHISTSIISDYTDVYLHYHDMIKTQPHILNLVEPIKNDERVKKLDNTMIFLGHQDRMFNPVEFAIWFVFCANEYGLEHAYKVMEKFLDSKEVEATATLWLLGLEVSEKIVLTDDYIIQPLSELPDSIEKRHFTSKAKIPLFGDLVPSCAITKNIVANKLASDEESNKYNNIISRLYDIATLLNILSNICCLSYYSTYFIDPKYNFVPLVNMGGMFDDDVRRIKKKYTLSGDIKLFNNLIDKYTKLKLEEKIRLNRAISLFSQAKRRSRIPDKMLDLGIALEMVLGDNNNKENNALLFRLRGSWLVGDAANRKENYDLLEKIYKYRSLVAHTGLLGKNDYKNATEKFSCYISLAEKIFQKIIINGFPNWEELVLDIK